MPAAAQVQQIPNADNIDNALKQAIAHSFPGASNDDVEIIQKIGPEIIDAIQAGIAEEVQKMQNAMNEGTQAAVLTNLLNTLMQNAQNDDTEVALDENGNAIPDLTNDAQEITDEPTAAQHEGAPTPGENNTNSPKSKKSEEPQSGGYPSPTGQPENSEQTQPRNPVQNSHDTTPNQNAAPATDTASPSANVGSPNSVPTSSPQNIGSSTPPPLPNTQQTEPSARQNQNAPEENIPDHTEDAQLEDDIPDHTSDAELEDDIPDHTEDAIHEDDLPDHTDDAELEDDDKAKKYDPFDEEHREQKEGEEEAQKQAGRPKTPEQGSPEGEENEQPTEGQAPGQNGQANGQQEKERGGLTQGINSLRFRKEIKELGRQINGLLPGLRQTDKEIKKKKKEIDNLKPRMFTYILIVIGVIGILAGGAGLILVERQMSKIGKNKIKIAELKFELKDLQKKKKDQMDVIQGKHKERSRLQNQSLLQRGAQRQ